MSDGIASTVADEFDTGDDVVIDRTRLPGAYQLQVNDFLCDGEFEVVADIRTLITATVDTEICSVTTVGTEPYGQGS